MDYTAQVKRTKQLPEKVVMAIKPLVPLEMNPLLLPATKVRIVNPWWHVFRRVHMFVLGGTILVSNDSTAFDFTGYLAKNRLKGMAHEVWHSLEARHRGPIWSVSSWLKARWDSLRRGKQYDHRVISYEQRAEVFANLVVNQPQFRTAAAVERFMSKEVRSRGEVESRSRTNGTL